MAVGEQVEASALALRYGVTFGKAILFEGDDYIGSVVNLSKRLCDAAAPHEILIGPGVSAYLPPWADVCDDGELPIDPDEMNIRRGTYYHCPVSLAGSPAAMCAA